MQKTLQHYIHAFRNINCGSNPNPQWSNGRSPYKPLLLLSVLDLIEDGTIAENIIPLPDESHQLYEAFHQYWDAFFPPSKKPDIRQPFVRLANDVPWYLVGDDGKRRLSQSKVKKLCKDGISKSRLKKRISHASFDDDLFNLLQEGRPRRNLRRFIIREYFATEAWDDISQNSRNNVISRAHAEWLIERAKGNAGKEPPTQEAPVREAGFRKAIVGIYNRRCAFCRLKVRSPENHTLVQAAHIIPWGEGQDDDPRNGLALCGVCHWTFDEGLLSLSGDLDILFSPYLERAGQDIGHLKGLKGTQMNPPEEPILWPREDALQWHRKKKFYKEI